MIKKKVLEILKKIKIEISELKKDKKKIYKTLIIIGSLILLVLLIILFTNINNNRKEKELERSLIEMGTDFYENFYYKQIEATDYELDTFLSKYKITGIKINLDSLGRYNNGVNLEKVSEFINDKTKKGCNQERTMLIIYPKDPYKKTDYTYKVVLKCGFK